MWWELFLVNLLLILIAVYLIVTYIERHGRIYILSGFVLLIICSGLTCIYGIDFVKAVMFTRKLMDIYRYKIKKEVKEDKTYKIEGEIEIKIEKNDRISKGDYKYIRVGDIEMWITDSNSKLKYIGNRRDMFSNEDGDKIVVKMKLPIEERIRDIVNELMIKDVNIGKYMNRRSFLFEEFMYNITKRDIIKSRSLIEFETNMILYFQKVVHGLLPPILEFKIEGGLKGFIGSIDRNRGCAEVFSNTGRYLFNIEIISREERSREYIEKELISFLSSIAKVERIGNGISLK